jgi:hypothetical protein
MIPDGMSVQQPTMHSVLMIGQSNMAGRGDMGQVKPIRNLLCYMLRMGRWQPMCEPVNPDRGIFEGRFRSGISLAASFADSLSKACREPVGLIPCADGGTYMKEWMPGELLYDHAVALTKLAQRTSKLTAIIWHQGESDCLRQEDVALYPQRLKEMIGSLRRELGAEDVPVLLGEIPWEIGPAWKTQGREVQFNTRLREVAAEIPLCAVVSSRGLSLMPDGVHFDSQACREFGVRYFEAYQTLVK